MHFGEEKTWYGIPGDQAKAFEAVVKDTVPELFETEPDLLQQLVTMVNPGLLVSKGVDVYMIDQSPGEFVVTFPQAYHAGLNTGFNFNEAVNFGPPDWLHYSRMSSEEYRNNKRMPVFSHEELVLRINYDYARRKLERPGWLVEELEYVLERELEDRQVVRDYDVKQKEIPGQENGVRRGEGGEGEERRDQEENCAECKAQLYQSYLVVDGQEPDKYCLREIGKLLDTEGIAKGKITMWYKYTDEQLMRMAGRVIKGNRAERDVIKWIEKYKELRKIKTERVSLAEMRSLLHYGAYLVPASVDTSANESSGKDEDGLSTVRSCMVELNKYVEKMNYYCYLTQALLRLCNKLDVVKSCGKINGTDGIQVLDPVCMYAHNQENEQQQSQNGAHQNVPSESESKGVEVSERPNVFMELYELIMKKHNKKLNSVEWVQESVDKFGDVSANRQRGLSTWYTYGNVIKVENVYNYSVGKQRYDIVSVIDEYFKSKNLDRPKQKLNINVYPSDIELVLKEFQDNHVDCYERRVLEEWVEKARSIEALVDAKVDEVYSNKDIDSKELQMDIAELSADIKEIGLEIKNASQLGVLQSVVKWAALAQKALSNRKTLTQDKVDELISTAETQYNVPKTHKLYVKLMEIQNRVHKWDAELNQTTSSRLNLRNIATLLDKGHNLDLVPNRFSELERLKDSILVFQRGLEDILDRSIREKFSNRPSLLEAQKVYCELEAANVTSLNQTSQLKSIINDAESWQAAVRSSFVNNSGVDSDMVSVLDNVVQSTNHCYVVLQKLKNSSRQMACTVSVCNQILMPQCCPAVYANRFTTPNVWPFRQTIAPADPSSLTVLYVTITTKSRILPKDHQTRC
ncbi:Lysine-specific demethylase lid [Zancudomyces culisetae]|uniref:Lysine-specific demethylase lid n=1 Tax=Zancudomyces culisetae TaxID=1213189 RepID=A0A1R1PM77_ZANCU|nr:Lysine-specific demethylase lid [Zancudomyces culisetae]OMH82163.1 Lysine-specific demethylase lid [Zancudomyces culisetae]|eukprot:OMH82081.1 Lysine-specific demethylase lid [Zancudomyces culisetae]